MYAIAIMELASLYCLSSIRLSDGLNLRTFVDCEILVVLHKI
jgi:hypothetical protein